MIRENEVFKIGKFIKPHGIKGEISFTFDNDVFDKVDCPYLICKIDGIFVPFFIREYRFKGNDTALITFEDIDDETKASRLTGLEVFFPRKYHEEASAKDIDYTWNFFLGFRVIDVKRGEIGIIDEIDESTINILFIVRSKEKEILIPATEEFIVRAEAKEKILYMNLIEGLIE